MTARKTKNKTASTAARKAEIGPASEQSNASTEPAPLSNEVQSTPEAVPVLEQTGHGARTNALDELQNKAVLIAQLFDVGRGTKQRRLRFDFGNGVFVTGRGGRYRVGVTDGHEVSSWQTKPDSLERALRMGAQWAKKLGEK